MAVSLLFGGPKSVEHENQNMGFLTFINLEHEIYDIGTESLLLQSLFLTGKSRFWKRFCQPFLDLKNSKAGTHVYKLLNLSDVKTVAKTFFKNTKYYNKSETLHVTLDSQVPIVLGFLPPEGVNSS